MTIRDSFKKLGRKIRGLAMANTLLKESLFNKQNIIDRQLTEIKRLKKNIDHLTADRSGSEALLRDRAITIAGLHKNANEANALMKAQRAINVKLTAEKDGFKYSARKLRAELKQCHKFNKNLIMEKTQRSTASRKMDGQLYQIAKLLKIKPRPVTQAGLRYKSKPKGTKLGED